MKKKILAGLLILASMATMAGCGNGNMQILTPPEEDPTHNTGTSDPAITGGVSGYEFQERQMSANNTINSAIITDMIAEANAGANVMYSPTSLNLALGLAGEGASGEGRELINTFLGTDNYADRAQQLMNGFADYNFEDEYEGYSCKLEVANALWVDKRIKLNKEFESVASAKYQAKAGEVDFSDAQNACNKINEWANDNTHGLIPAIVDPSVINPDTRLCITNSLYFESAWSEEWSLNPNEADFTLFDGSTQQINYISSEGGAYYENEYATAFSCSYINGIKFIGILPKAEGEFTLEGLDIDSLLASKNYNHDELYYKMPRLNFETSNSLNDAFKAIGMGKLFGEGAGFDGIAQDDNLFISSIIQKTKLELDQYGTKAAAVTAIMMDCESATMIEEDPIVRRVYLDRPFAFLIYDEENAEILFMGKVVTAL